MSKSLERRVEALEQIVSRSLNANIQEWHEHLDEQDRLAAEAAEQAKERTAAFKKLSVDELDTLAADHAVSVPDGASKDDKVAALEAAGVPSPGGE